MNNNHKIKALNKSILSSFEECVSIITKICESPIEKMFLLKLIDYVLKRQDSLSMEFIYEERDEIIVVNGVETVHPEVNYRYPSGFGRLSGIKIKDTLSGEFYFELYPQYKISYTDFKGSSQKETNYRLDFGVFKYSKHNNELLNKYCIECDGHQFHSEKEQIVKDNGRMKDLLLRKKFITLKYSGSEIYHLKEEDIGRLIMNFTTNLPEH